MEPTFACGDDLALAVQGLVRSPVGYDAAPAGIVRRMIVNRVGSRSKGELR
jgi:hypothetical protein